MSTIINRNLADTPPTTGQLPHADEFIRLVAYVSSAIVSTAPFDRRLSSVLSCINTSFLADACIVRLLNRGKLDLIASSGVTPATLVQSLPANQGISATLLETGRGLIVVDVPSDPITAALHANRPPGHYTFSHYAGAPMLVEGQPIGVMGVFRKQADDQFDESDLVYLEVVANQLAVLLQNQKLYEQQAEQSGLLEKEIAHRKRAEKKLQSQLTRAEQLTTQLQQALQSVSSAYDATLEGWCAALDLRDEGTMGHTNRVTQLTVQLATELGFPTEEMTKLRRGALLHDIGKMGIPDSILLKPGPLTDDEWTIMRRHPGLAHEFLQRNEFLAPCDDIPFCHHEKWDGSGYPRGLKATEIPLAARIFAVVDVWDALSSDRPYRPAWEPARVLDHIRASRGTHFDPEIADAFLRMVEKQPLNQ